jgi:hypothetical protein
MDEGASPFLAIGQTPSVAARDVCGEEGAAPWFDAASFAVRARPVQTDRPLTFQRP